MDHPALEQHYLHLTNHTLPDAAAPHRWPVRLNHCFQRIILDALFQDCWYHHLDRGKRTAAYRQLTDEQLQRAVDLAQRMLREPELLPKLNQQSLRYRGKG
ncbi:MAG: hypothetical protein WA958_12640 [Tunicatimonas sp.]